MTKSGTPTVHLLCFTRDSVALVLVADVVLIDRKPWYSHYGVRSAVTELSKSWRLAIFVVNKYCLRPCLMDLSNLLIKHLLRSSSLYTIFEWSILAITFSAYFDELFFGGRMNVLNKCSVSAFFQLACKSAASGWILGNFSYAWRTFLPGFLFSLHFGSMPVSHVAWERLTFWKHSKTIFLHLMDLDNVTCYHNSAQNFNDLDWTERSTGVPVYFQCYTFSHHTINFWNLALVLWWFIIYLISTDINCLLKMGIFVWCASKPSTTLRSKWRLHQ